LQLTGHEILTHANITILCRPRYKNEAEATFVKCPYIYIHVILKQIFPCRCQHLTAIVEHEFNWISWRNL